MLGSINKRSIITLIIFGMIYALISLVNHQLFRTYSLDLGLYTNALYDYSHFQFNDSTTFKESSENLLADHFDIYLMLFSMLSYFLGTNTLLVVQIAALIFGALGVKKYFDQRHLIPNLGYPAMLFFLLFFGVFNAVSQDYHSNVVAACLVPWFFIQLEKKKYQWAFMWFFLILIAKENMSLWLFFIGLGGIIHYRKDKRTVFFLFIISVLSAGSFVLITSVIMPYFSNQGIYIHFNYSILGKNASEALIHLINHPIDSFLDLFVNHKSDPNCNYIKTELHLFLLLSGLPFLIRYPGFILMLAPIYAQKLFHDNPMMWSIGVQYNIEFAPILALGIFLAIEKITSAGLRKSAILLVLIGTAAVTLRSMDSTVIYTRKDNIRFYSKGHYQRDYNIKAVRSAMKEIPEDAIVSAQSPFVPHLSLRDKIYTFPIIKDAEYLLFSPKEGTYPLNSNAFNNKMDSLLNSDKWTVRTDRDSVFLLQRK